MKSTLASAVAFLAVAVQSSVVFIVSTEAGDKGIQGSWVTDRWVCHNFTEPFYKNVSWAFVSSGLANGCTLYDDDGCKGDHYNVEKYQGNLCCPGDVNMTDVGFDNRAASWSCY